MLALLLCALLAVRSHALNVRVPESPVVALFGMDTVLNCSFSGAAEFNLSDLSVFWQLSDTKRIVHSYSQSRDQLIDQDDRFVNRTSLYPDQLMAGNVSLLLKKVRVADEGSYMCFVKVQTYSSGAMLMQVAAPFSKPLVTWGTESNLKPGDVVALTCVAYGGYPEAQVLWQDGAGRNLTDNVTISQVANEEGLFSVKSVLTVTLEPNSTYNCRLTNPLLGEEGQASVTITATTTESFHNRESRPSCGELSMSCLPSQRLFTSCLPSQRLFTSFLSSQTVHVIPAQPETLHVMPVQPDSSRLRSTTLLGESVTSSFSFVS